MSAIVIQPHIHGRGLTVEAADFMPLSTRIHVAGELNRLWAEFVNEMHSGPTIGGDTAAKFWNFVTSRGPAT
jgi:hypothetical protein